MVLCVLDLRVSAGRTDQETMRAAAEHWPARSLTPWRQEAEIASLGLMLRQPCHPHLTLEAVPLWKHLGNEMAYIKRVWLRSGCREN